jgi:AraC-like DNA-binding protein
LDLPTGKRQIDNASPGVEIHRMPWGRVLTFADPFPYQSAMQSAEVEIYPTERGEFHSELTQIGLNNVWMQRYHEKLPRVFATKMKPDRRVICFLTDENQAAMRLCSMDVPPLAVVVGRDEIHQRNEAGSRYATMSLPTADLHAAYRAIVGRELVSPPSTYLTRPDHTLMSRLLELHKTASLIAKTAPSLFELPEMVRNLEQQLIHVWVRCLAEGAPSQMSTGTLRHAAIVKRFEDFLEMNPDQPLYLTEICAAIGVAERTLRAACEEHLGMGPIRYLSLRRMHLVRRALLRADPSTTTVTRVATDFGFWELGRFSVAYRVLFAESPSESLRRHMNDQIAFLNRPSSLEIAGLHH